MMMMMMMIRKPIVNFLLVIIKLFSLGVITEVIWANIDWKSAFLKGVGQFGLKFQVEDDVPHQPFFMSRKLKWSVFHVV